MVPWPDVELEVVRPDVAFEQIAIALGSSNDWDVAEPKRLASRRFPNP